MWAAGPLLITVEVNQFLMFQCFLSLETGWRPICGDTIQRTEASRAASSMSPWRHLAAVHAHSWLCALGIMASSHHTGSSPSGATLEIEFEEEQEETSGEEEPSI